MNELEIHKYLKKIINSKAFSHSEVYGNLLNYLTEATFQGKKPKEFTIGADVFNQKADSPTTSKVRVSVHNLRKKLDLYYQEEGYGDAVRFSIPKGTYTVEFKSNKERFFKKYARTILIALSVVILIVILEKIAISMNGSDSLKLRKTDFWNDLLSNKKETIIVIGDYFIFQEKQLSMGKDSSNTDSSEENVRQYMGDAKPNEGYVFPQNNSYIPYAAILSLPYVIPLLDRNEVNYKIVLSSNFRWETFNNSNIIYIGSLKNLNALSYLTENKLHIKYVDYNNTLTLSDLDEDRVYTSSIENNVTTDYTLVAKLPGPSDNVFYLFGSNHEVGCIESIKYFTQIDSLNSFGKNRLEGADYFKGIFKAEGVERINMLFNLVECECIRDSTLINFWHY